MTIHDSGYRRTFEIARDELAVFSSSGTAQVTTIPYWLQAAEIHQKAVHLQEATGSQVELVLYEKDRERSSSSRRILTRKIVVHVAQGKKISTIAERVGAVSVEALAYAPQHFILRTDRAGEALRMAEALRHIPGVISADPLLGRELRRKAVPNDPLFPNQWFLLNRGQSGGKTGFDLGVTNVWDRYRGRGVTIAIVDDGLQLTHPDLAQNVQTKLHYDYRDGDGDPNPAGAEDFHGTAVAGIAAARGDNSVGVAGIAFEATLVGLRLVGGNVHTDAMSAAALTHSNQVVQVSNNSWGAEDTGKTLDAPGPLMQMARENAVRNGRGGKGTVFVWPAGNGGEVQDDANYDGYVSSRHVITVGAVTDEGRRAAYSEPGASLAVSAPSDISATSTRPGIVTTDLVGEDGLNFTDASGDLQDINYTQYFGGTSAAAAMVSGVAGLLLEANPNLGWRDVKEILIRSATLIDPTDPDWATNGAGFRFNHRYGAGLVNAFAAVKLATNWVNLGPQTSLSKAAANLPVSIPDNDFLGTAVSFDLRKSPALRVEHAEVTVAVAHPRRGDLAITLVSPHGMRSRLAERHPDFSPDYPNWTFTSVFHWGEMSQGVWKVQVADLNSDKAGTIQFVRLELFGTESPRETRPWLSASRLGETQVRLRLTAEPGYRYEIQSSANFVDWIGILTTNLITNGTVELDEDIAGNFQPRYFRALRQPSSP
ncbi:MAG: S8 family serine peptidase [Verrucomicrobia bacterium]|nr:S8 family serine peptidase [Verrucomicrobiota bacterium]